jgi:uncharacterized protein YjiS (DUF1127 family)
MTSNILGNDISRRDIQNRRSLLCRMRAAWHYSVSAPSALCSLLLLWYTRFCERGRLSMLNEHMLKDIGVSRADVLRETSKGFWKP